MERKYGKRVSREEIGFAPKARPKNVVLWNFLSLFIQRASFFKLKGALFYFFQGFASAPFGPRLCLVLFFISFGCVPAGTWGFASAEAGKGFPLALGTFGRSQSKGARYSPLEYWNVLRLYRGYLPAAPATPLVRRSTFQSILLGSTAPLEATVCKRG